MGNVKLKGSLSCGGQELVEFKILGAIGGCAASSLPQTSEGQSSGLFKELLSRLPWNEVLEERGAQRSWLILKVHLLQAQEQCVRKKRMSSKNTRKSSWKNKKHLDKFKLRKEAYRRWKQEQVDWEEYKEIIQATRNWVRKTKTLTELNLARNAKDNKSCSRHISDERKIGENVGLLQEETGDLEDQDMKKTEILNDFFTLVLNGKCSSHATQATEGKGRY